MYTESNVKLSCNALWQKCVLATLYRAAATHPEIKLLQFKLIPGQGINKAIPCHERCNSDPHPTPEIRS
ncbi:hypothetical protein, partial [Escherichia coli]|uniref:hypothetical protein n=1 Tax=Escherichia coli TaxID=562 RepID=UPI001A7E07F4